ncbi:MAG: hypothetical protein WBM90_06340 [Acidimicrobiia bacterium]
MITEERAMVMFVEANPVPSRDDVAFAPDGGAAYLATLEQRSSEVTQLDTKGAQTGAKRGKRIPLLIAALLVVIVGVAVILISQRKDEAPVVTQPTSTTVADPAGGAFEGEWDAGSTTIRFEGNEYVILQSGVSTDWGIWSSDEITIQFESSTDTEACLEGDTAIVNYSFEGEPNALELAVGEDDCAERGLGTTPQDGPEVRVSYVKLGTATTGDPEWDSTPVFTSPRSESPISAGEYRTARFAKPFRFTLSDGWVSYVPQSVNSVDLSTKDLPELNIVFKLFEQPTVDATVAAFTSREELRTNEPVPISIAGAQGFTFDLAPEKIVTVFNDENGAFSDRPGENRVQIAVVDVGGLPVSIVIGHPDDGGTQFETMGQPLLDSIIWKDIG